MKFIYGLLCKIIKITTGSYFSFVIIKNISYKYLVRSKIAKGSISVRYN